MSYLERRMGVESMETSKSTTLSRYLSEKERRRSKHTEIQSPWMYFPKKRNLLVEGKQERESV